MTDLSENFHERPESKVKTSESRLLSSSSGISLFESTVCIFVPLIELSNGFCNATSYVGFFQGLWFPMSCLILGISIVISFITSPLPFHRPRLSRPLDPSLRAFRISYVFLSIEVIPVYSTAFSRSGQPPKPATFYDCYSTGTRWGGHGSPRCAPATHT